MSEETLKVGLKPAGQITALLTRPEGPETDLLFVYAPGAGSNLHDPFGAFIAPQLARLGISCLRFQFPYMEAGRSIPDRNPLLESTWLAVIEAARGLSSRVVVGGRSMGGRIASQVVAKGASVAALALFAYPLHPPGRPDRARDRHLPSILVPTLFCSGTRDTFATPQELEAAGSLVPDPTFHFIAGADHGFNVLRATGLTRADIWQEASSILESFLESLPPPSDQSDQSGPRG